MKWVGQWECNLAVQSAALMAEHLEMSAADMKAEKTVDQKVGQMAYELADVWVENLVVVMVVLRAVWTDNLQAVWKA